MIRKIYDALFHGENRLKANFPWSFGKMAKTYVIASLIYLVGSLLPLLLMMAFVIIGTRYFPDFISTHVLVGDTLEANMGLLVGITVASFLTGFGAELLYIRRVFHRDGISMRKAMVFNLDSLNGSWWAAIWRAAAAFAVVVVINLLMNAIMPKAHDPAANFALSLSGWSFLAFGLLAGLAAPFFEELIFRGFLFNVCRTSFRQGRWFKIFRTENVADYAAMLVSGAAFAAAHMNLSGFPALLVMGLMLAWLYRRSGSLVCPMLLHAFNNITAIVLLYLKVGM